MRSSSAAVPRQLLQRVQESTSLAYRRRTPPDGTPRPSGECQPERQDPAAAQIFESDQATGRSGSASAAAPPLVHPPRRRAGHLVKGSAPGATPRRSREDRDEPVGQV